MNWKFREHVLRLFRKRKTNETNLEARSERCKFTIFLLMLRDAKQNAFSLEKALSKNVEESIHLSRCSFRDFFNFQLRMTTEKILECLSSMHPKLARCTHKKRPWKTSGSGIPSEARNILEAFLQWDLASKLPGVVWAD